MTPPGFRQRPQIIRAASLGGRHWPDQTASTKPRPWKNQQENPLGSGLLANDFGWRATLGLAQRAAFFDQGIAVSGRRGTLNHPDDKSPGSFPDRLAKEICYGRKNRIIMQIMGKSRLI